ncbi:MAG TPA: SET domain-containing protein-lysine N-methyltransferase [Candidatus Nanoarchaeia archaeon]|nr:SET domain-containing protein-lysine N-methyltransferase [Candidatus Nanoarchaeia archaeon]
MDQTPTSMQLPRIRVSTSGIHGTGVYAVDPIGKGERIIEYVGEKVTSEEGTRRSKLHPQLTYIFILSDQYDIDGSVGGNESQYINHSCDPNADTDVVDGHIWIIALKDIAAGEEITYDYSFASDDDPIECRCQKGNCRGYLNEYASVEEKAKMLAQFKAKQEQEASLQKNNV